MRYLLPLILGLTIISCGLKTDDPNPTGTPTVDPAEQLASEIVLIESYLSNNNLTAQTTNSNLYYIIEELGDGAAITENSVVTALLKGYYLDGTVFSETLECSPVTISLANLIKGFKEGATLFNVGGKGTIILPSELAFGPQGSNTGSVPPNAVLAYDVAFVDLSAFERSKMKSYLAENELVADSTDSGIFYVIEEPGTGDSPTINSTISIKYRGYFTDGQTFDESLSGTTFQLNGLIPGWQEALPLLKPGGKGTFLIPSSLAYGVNGSNTIPSNTMLLFDIELLSFE